MSLQFASDDEIVAAIRSANGNLTTAARTLGVRTPYLRKRIQMNPKVLDAYSEHLDEICDLAIDQLKNEILNGNTKAILFALDRLGHARGFVNQKTVLHGGDPFNPIKVESSVNMDNLSIDEKRVLMKLAREKVEAVNVTPERQLG